MKTSIVWLIAGLVLACLLFAGTGSGPVAVAGGLAGGVAGMAFGLIGLVVGIVVALLALILAGPVVVLAVLFGLVVAGLALVGVALMLTLPVLLPLGLLVGLVWLVARAAGTPPPPRPMLPAPR